MSDSWTSSTLAPTPWSSDLETRRRAETSWSMTPLTSAVATDRRVSSSRSTIARVPSGVTRRCNTAWASLRRAGDISASTASAWTARAPAIPPIAS
jgi:hypothetical protein